MDEMQHRGWRRRRNEWRTSRNNFRPVFGIIIAAFGLLMLLNMFQLLPPLMYSVHFGWPLILIVVGIAIGIRSDFRNNAWWILTLIGAVHFLPTFYIGSVRSKEALWPALAVAAGLAMVFQKKKYVPSPETAPVLTHDADTINIDVTFGGRKEIVTSRSFRGGMVRATFAGAEVNLAAADSGIQPMVLEIHASFAGVEIIVPSHWEIQNEINPTMGSVEDQRMVRTHDMSTEKRVLILRGSCSFGSVEIKSY